MSAIPYPTPSLRGRVVTLRPWAAGDLPAVTHAGQDPLIARYVAALQAPSATAQEAWLAQKESMRKAGTGLELAIVRPHGPSLACGSVGLLRVVQRHKRAMMGFWMAPEYRGKGMASEAVRLLAEWAFATLALERIEIFTEPQNLASQHVAEQAGFVREGLLRSRWLSQEGRRDSVVYGLLPSDLR